MASFAKAHLFGEQNMQNSKAYKTLFSLLLVLSTIIAAYGQTDVPRRTTAITYPLDELVMVQFRGTTRFPRMKGDARIKRTSRNGTEIELSVSKMPRPFELGAGYATYVLWAVSPDGQVDNLGEIKRRGFFEFDSKISVTTPLQTFALIITAEPHFLVRSPSQEIMLENLSPYTASGRKITTTPSVQYFGNSSDYFRDARTPEIAELDYSKLPSAILQAKQAVALARFAGAERDAPEEFREAQTLLQNAEGAWNAQRDEETIDIAARRAISASVKAESTALVRKDAREKRNEKTRADAEVRQAESRYTDAQSEIADLKAELARETRNRELAERDAMNYSTQLKEAQAENGRMREELGKTKVEAEAARNRLAAIEREKQEIVDRQNDEQKAAQVKAGQETLIQSLKRFGTVSNSDRGIVLTLPEAYFTAPRALAITAASQAKLTALGELLAGSPDYNVFIESHTDNKGTVEELENLTLGRARAIAEKLDAAGVAETRLDARGIGASLPVAPNTTNANRAKNRRVLITLVLKS
jgi:outer membrane protein OmpA-like peptidoglycan-associated protein